MKITKTEILNAIVDRIWASEWEGTPTKARKHKKHVYKYTCQTCGVNYKGKRGLGIHRAKAHNVPAV